MGRAAVGCRGWKESKSLKALREPRAPILSDPRASVGKRLQRECSARSEEIMTERGCLNARVGVEMHWPLLHWSTIPWGRAPGPLWPHDREHRAPCREFIIHTHTCTTHITTQLLHQEMSDLICLLYTLHGGSYDANQDTTYSVTLLYFSILYWQSQLLTKNRSTLELIVAKNWPQKTGNDPLTENKQPQFVQLRICL